MEDLRKSLRYALNRLYSGNVSIEIHCEERIICSVLDLSAGGLSFEIEIGKEEKSASIENEKEFFITIKTGDLLILAGVEKVWSTVRETETGRYYTSGVRFKMLANEERLKLNEEIEHIRRELQSISGSRLEV